MKTEMRALSQPKTTSSFRVLFAVPIMATRSHISVLYAAPLGLWWSLLQHNISFRACHARFYFNHRSRILTLGFSGLGLWVSWCAQCLHMDNRFLHIARITGWAMVFLSYCLKGIVTFDFAMCTLWLHLVVTATRLIFSISGFTTRAGGAILDGGCNWHSALQLTTITGC